MNNQLAPVCLFVYSRLEQTQKTVASLQRSFLAEQTELFVFSDAPEHTSQAAAVSDVREYIHTITGFASVNVSESPSHKGLAASVISGVTEIIRRCRKVIVVEDDLEVSTNFLCYMNEALDFYETRKQVFSVSGYSFDLKYPRKYPYDVAFSLRASSWGWATWLDRWSDIDWKLSDYPSFHSHLLKRLRFNRGGSDLSHMLDRQRKGEIDSWAIRYVFHQFIHDYLDVFPIRSKVRNNGFSSDSTHTKYKSSRFETTLDETGQCSFNFAEPGPPDYRILLQFYEHYSYTIRLRDKIMKTLQKATQLALLPNRNQRTSWHLWLQI